MLPSIKYGQMGFPQLNRPTIKFESRKKRLNDFFTKILRQFTW